MRAIHGCRVFHFFTIFEIKIAWVAYDGVLNTDSNYEKAN